MKVIQNIDSVQGNSLVTGKGLVQIERLPTVTNVGLPIVVR